MAIRLFDQTIDRLARGLEFTSRRHDVLTKNVANIETPNYRARDVSFDDFLNAMQPAAADAGLPPATRTLVPGEPEPHVVYASDGAAREDGNDVNLDRQMARLAENTLFNHTLVNLLTSRFNQMKQAISGRV